MTISNDHMTGFLLGVGATAYGFYWYRKNQVKVDEFLRRNGIEPPLPLELKSPDAMTLEELMVARERFEDLIAEREQQRDGGGAATPETA